MHFDDEGDAVSVKAESTEDVIRKEREEDAKREAEATEGKNTITLGKLEV